MKPSLNFEKDIDRQFANNLSRGLAVLKVFTVSNQLLGNIEISRLTGLPKATVFRLTYTLELLGLLTRVERLQKFRLGPEVLTLGYPMLAGMEIRHIVRPYMEQLATKTRWSVNLGMLGRLELIYVDAMRYDKGNLLKPDIGSSRPLLTTAMGRVLLISSKPEDREAILNRLKLQDASRFRREIELLHRDQDFYEKNQYCLSMGDLAADVIAIAVPIKGVSTDAPLFAMNCTVSGHKITKTEIAKNIAPQLIEARRNIERAQAGL